MKIVKDEEVSQTENGKEAFILFLICFIQIRVEFNKDFTQVEMLFSMTVCSL